MTFTEHMREAAKQYLLAQLEEHGGSVQAAARVAGLHRSYFYRLVHDLGLAEHLPRSFNKGNEMWQQLGVSRKRHAWHPWPRQAARMKMVHP